MSLVMPLRIKILLVAMTASAFAIFGVAYWKNHDVVRTCGEPDAIEQIFPSCGDQVFRQSDIRVDMAPGYAVELTLNGEPIPLDQLESPPAGDSIDVQIAPSIFAFRPGVGKIIETLRPEENCVIATYRKLSENESTARPFRWCFRVS